MLLDKFEGTVRNLLRMKPHPHKSGDGTRPAPGSKSGKQKLSDPDRKKDEAEKGD